MTKRKTTLVRMYTDDRDMIKMRFPEVKMPDFIHINVRTNFFTQVEAALRKGKKKR